MATPTLTEYLNTLYTTTWAKRRPNVVDQVLEENRFLALLNSKGMVKYENTDGRRLEIPLSIKRTTTSKFFGKGATFTITDFDPLTVAYDYWKNQPGNSPISARETTEEAKLMGQILQTLCNSSTKNVNGQRERGSLDN